MSAAGADDAGGRVEDGGEVGLVDGLPVRAGRRGRQRARGAQGSARRPGERRARRRELGSSGEHVRPQPREGRHCSRGRRGAAWAMAGRGAPRAAARGARPHSWVGPGRERLGGEGCFLRRHRLPDGACGLGSADLPPPPPPPSSAITGHPTPRVLISLGRLGCAQQASRKFAPPRRRCAVCRRRRRHRGPTPRRHVLLGLAARGHRHRRGPAEDGSLLRRGHIYRRRSLPLLLADCGPWADARRARCQTTAPRAAPGRTTSCGTARYARPPLLLYPPARGLHADAASPDRQAARSSGSCCWRGPWPCASRPAPTPLATWPASSPCPRRPPSSS